MIAIIAALKEEIAGILRAGSFERQDAPHPGIAYIGRLPGIESEVVLLITGTGGQRAYDGCSWLLGTHRPESLISTGFAGGLQESLSTGDLILATEIIRLEGRPFDWDPGSALEPIQADPSCALLAREAVELTGIDFFHGRVISAPAAVKTAGLKRWLGSTFQAVGVDMESHYIGQAAGRAGVPYLCARAVLDTVEMDLPELVDETGDLPSGNRLAPVLRHLRRHPASTPRVVRLALTAAQARRAITAFVTSYIRAGSRVRTRQES